MIHLTVKEVRLSPEINDKVGLLLYYLRIVVPVARIRHSLSFQRLLTLMGRKQFRVTSIKSIVLFTLHMVDGV